MDCGGFQEQYTYRECRKLLDEVDSIRHTEAEMQQRRVDLRCALSGPWGANILYCPCVRVIDYASTATAWPAGASSSCVGTKLNVADSEVYQML